MARGGLRNGAGRPGWHVRAEHCLRLNIQDLARRKLLNGGVFTWQWTNNSTGALVGAISMATGPDSARLMYSHADAPINHVVRIVKTRCNYGGSRPWFMCPRCDRRVGVLFLRAGHFMCRHCGRIAYSSQSEDQIGRMWRRQSKLERRLGESWTRPKGMHVATHNKILDSIFGCEERRELALMAFIHTRGLLQDLGF